MGSLESVIEAIHQFILAAYHDVNNWVGLLIALFAVVLMSNWKQLLPLTLGATIVRVIADILMPAVQKGKVSLAEVKLPEFLVPAFWSDKATLFVGFLILIAMFFAVKKVVFMRGGHAKRAKAHG